MTYSNELYIEGDHRMADVIDADERLLLIIERFGISLGFGDKTINEVCAEYRLDTSLVLVVMNVFNDHSFPATDYLTENMIPGLMKYLKNAHHYFLKEKLPFIGELIDRFIKNTNNPDTRLIRTFFKEYEQEVYDHMNLEDTKVFPYIQKLYDLAEGKKASLDELNFSIDYFVEHHTDLEEKVYDLKHVLIKHFPPTKDRFYRNMILLELYNLQYDLFDHAEIEDRILTPLVRKLEQKKGVHE